MPNIDPTAKTPTAILSTARNVRVLLCQISNQILYQMTLMVCSDSLTGIISSLPALQHFRLHGGQPRDEALHASTLTRSRES